jgi:hypothetical protein
MMAAGLATKPRFAARGLVDGLERSLFAQLARHVHRI